MLRHKYLCCMWYVIVQLMILVVICKYKLKNLFLD